ncbi:ImmA/IrrE family metallo-endopeptidase [Dysosmobacter sp.]|uniref:ImmA/IrrE family metallo-endopeptidase n=1 Tax=Dysosmobacter sp. TaxID=2591382 RepID=UPI002A8F2765|nr:ImmA/IrrE family metallo-endopeptidase [Dysosmobacter sp.]MDY3984264.1 ImmA/IrrE family metallo-endopeptidase [Dysosmobacter sp.]
MSYKDYQTARNAAWQILIDCHVDRLPMDIRAICRHLGCKLYSYDTGWKLIAAFRLQEQTEKTDGFTVLYRDVPYIFYSSSVPESRQRFTIAHEIGHIVLRHVGEGKYTIMNREPAPGDSADETQANQFAVRILAPACVLNALGAVDAGQISALCGISRQAAEFRAERMKQLRTRGKFLSHPLEREVMRQFEPFVRSRLGSL